MFIRVVSVDYNTAHPIARTYNITWNTDFFEREKKKQSVGATVDLPDLQALRNNGNGPTFTSNSLYYRIVCVPDSVQLKY